MLVEDVRKLKPLDRFMYWCRERMNIYHRRKAGLPKPWTNDEILQTQFFTNVYRELDKTTVWFREHVREPLRDDIDVVMATVIFRWFNHIQTGLELCTNYGHTPTAKTKAANDLRYSLLVDWDACRCMSLLGPKRDAGEKIFTGAFMVNSPAGVPKLEAIVERIDAVWAERKTLQACFYEIDPSRPVAMEAAHKALTQFDGLGGFMAYEIVCDLRYTRWLENAPDKMTWCNVGPGCRRGLYRLLGVPFDKGNNSQDLPPLPDEMGEMVKLLGITKKQLKMSLEMREIEHSMCEWDKAERGWWGDGKLKRKFNGV